MISKFARRSNASYQFTVAPSSLPPYRVPLYIQIYTKYNTTVYIYLYIITLYQYVYFVALKK